MEGHHCSIWGCKYPWPDRHLRILSAGPCACRASWVPPAAHLHGISYHIWGVAQRVLLSTDLPEEPVCSPHCGPGKSCHWKSCSSQQGATGNPPDGNLWRICQCLSERLDPGWVKSPGSRILVWGMSKDGPGSCWLDGNTSLPIVTWTWESIPHQT